jgi:predicted metal-dependent phosphoesterase TrpH
MQNRLQQNYFPRYLPIYIPKGYQENDFSDIITELKKRNFFDIEKGNITLRIYSKGEYFERFNKKFYIHIFSTFGQISISIIEVKDDTIMQSLIRTLEEEIKEINKHFIGMIADRDNWLKRWFKVRQEFKNQKRQIKKLLLEMSIKIEPGSELSKLLRLDNIPEGRIML